jgi:hypothetical protein
MVTLGAPMPLSLGKEPTKLMLYAMQRGFNFTFKTFQMLKNLEGLT